MEIVSTARLRIASVACACLLYVSSMAFCQVIAPSTIEANANAYKNLAWTSANNNITGGAYLTYACTSLATKWVVTPSWVSPTSGASKTGMPYKWGGENSISQFQMGISSGKKAGDRISSYNGTSYSCGSTEAVGVDCAGFVCRAWGRSSSVGTTGIPGISQQLSSYTALQKGDVMNKPSPNGHVRLLITPNSNGTYSTIESGSGIENSYPNGYWKVFAWTYTTANMGTMVSNGYLPRRYNYANDEPCHPLPIPVNSTCTYITNVGNGGATYTPSTSVPNPTCGAYTSSNKDVWYRFTVPSTTNYRVQVQTGTLTSLGFAIYQGGCYTTSNTLTQIPGKCTTVSGSGTTGVITGTSTSGYWLYVRVWGTSTTTGTFKICVKNSLMREDEGELEMLNAADAKIFPNPNAGSFTFESLDEVNQQGELEVFNTLGQVVFSKTLNNIGGLFVEKCDLSHLANGMYHVRFTAGQSEVHRKISINQ